MLNIKKSIAQGFGKGGLYDILKELQLFSAGIQGEVYFVDGNAGDDGNLGKSWDDAFKTLTAAMAVSHANIAASSKGWAARNTIFCKGDTLDEDLTTLAQKTDIIGVGSCDDQPRCRITGTHLIPTTYVYAGCRFFNMAFIDDGASACFSFVDQAGIEFHDCDFWQVGTGTYGISFSGNCSRIKIKGCRFLGQLTGSSTFSAAAIRDADTTTYGLEISNCYITGAIGIDCNATTVYDGLIKDNVIVATGLVIDDESNDLVIVNNRLISAAAKGTIGNVIDYNAAIGAGNILTGSDGTINVPSCTD